METLQLLATALGLSALSGINLYLTVFATSLALNLGWLQLSPELQQLQVLASPGILVISGILYFVEFFADKVPGLDSLWDTIHTAIRPLGAAFLSISVLGQTDPAIEVAAVLLCTGVAMTTHATKAGIRALINTSPEPVSNVVASVAEDVVVAGGVGLVFVHPIVAMALTLIFVAAFIYFAPKLFRHARAVITFALSRLFSKKAAPEAEAPATELPIELPEKILAQVKEVMRPQERIAWAIKALTGRIPGIGANRRCFLVLLEGGGKNGSPDAAAMPPSSPSAKEAEGRRLLFYVKSKPLAVMSLEDISVQTRSTLLFHEITITDKASAAQVMLRFSYGQGPIKDAVLQDIIG